MPGDEYGHPWHCHWTLGSSGGAQSFRNFEIMFERVGPKIARVKLDREKIAHLDEEFKKKEESNSQPSVQSEVKENVSKTSHGGKRTGAGRPSLGVTKKLSLTLPENAWEELERLLGNAETRRQEGSSMSGLLRDIILKGI